MKRVRAISLTVGLLACAAALLPLSASAGLPKPRVALIVPFTSLDGVSLGTTKAQALQKWGRGGPSLCSFNPIIRRDTCGWFAQTTVDFPIESAALELSGGRVCGMFIRAGSSSRSSNLTITGLKRWKTKEGVGLGSTLRAAKKVLGKLRVEKRGIITIFGPNISGKRPNQVGEITIFRKNCPVT